MSTFAFVRTANPKLMPWDDLVEAGASVSQNYAMSSNPTVLSLGMVYFSGHWRPNRSAVYI